MNEDINVIRDQMETFNTQQEVCDLLDITVVDLLDMFNDRLEEYVDGER